MNKEELLDKIENVQKEIRNNADAYLDTSNDVEVLNKRGADLKAELNQLKKDLAQMSAPVENKDTEERSIFNKDLWLRSYKENRSITIGGTGNISQIKKLIHEVADSDSILNSASFYYGPNASTNIPVLTPVADPTGQAEGATSIGYDTTAGVTVTEIQPKAYVSVLPISAEMLSMGSVNLEAELPTMFSKAFARTMHDGMLAGLGTDKAMKGLFVSASAHSDGVTNVAGTSIKLSELAGLALKVRGKDEVYTIVMNPATYQAMLSDATAGEDVKIYKESMIRDKSIEGVQVVLDNRAPATTSAGDVLAVAVPLSRYAIGVAGQMDITPIRVPGDTNTYFQATMFFSGKQVTDKDIYSLAVAN